MTNVQHLYSALHKHGLPRKKLVHILPEWWTQELEETPSGAQQAKLYLAKALSLRIRPFSETPPRIEFDLPTEKRFKRSERTTDAELQVAVALAQSASRIALSSMDDRYIPPPPSASAIRKIILEKGSPWVGLSQLLEYCWSSGIPVLHLATQLLGKKMDGIAMSIKGRPSIVLSSKRNPGFLLFHLAHELGHIALGHVAANGAVVDDVIDKGESGKHQDEVDADRFAIELLTGNAEAKLTLGTYIKAPALAESAKAFGLQHKIDPTHVVMNCAHNDKNNIFGLCVLAAKIISEDKQDSALVTQFAYNNLHDSISPDNEHLLINLIK